jgi:hypothetical protein
VPTKTRRLSDERMDQWVKKHKDRIKTFAHTWTKVIAAYAERNRVALVMYDDSVRAYVDNFPWHMLRQMLSYKLNERGINFEIVEKKKKKEEDTEQQEIMQ